MRALALRVHHFLRVNIIIAIFYLSLHGHDGPAFALSPSQYYDLEYVFSAQPIQHNFRPQGLNGETLPFLFREYDSCA